MPVYNWRALRVATEAIGPNEGLAASEIEAMELAETAMANPVASLALVQPMELHGETLRCSGPSLIGVRTMAGRVKWWIQASDTWLTTEEYRDQPSGAGRL